MRTKRAVLARSARYSCSSFSARAASFSARVPRRRLLAAAAVPSMILIAAVTGCSGASSSSSPASSGAVLGAADAAPSAAAAAGSSSSAQNGFAASAGARAGTAARYVPTGQQLIYTAQLTVRAADVSSAVTRATSIVSAAGGYVSAENASSGQGKPSQASATVTLKIPVAAYAATLATLSGGGLGAQLSLSQQAQDVTQQVADVNSRVASDEAAIAQLRSLLKHAGDVSSLLSVQNQINSQESDLESMLAQQSALNHETAYATVTLTLVGPQAPAKPAPKAAPPPGLAGGIVGGWHALRVTVSWLLTVIGAVAPFAAVLAVIAGVVWWARRRVARRRQKPAA
jgi:Domain of unknown function (DUF4349)